MSALVRKIIVDSRAFLNNAPAQSGTFELPEIVELYGNEALYLQSFHCVASWLSVDSTNDTMYLIENGTTTVARTVKLPHAAYDADSLATQLQAALNGAGKITPGQYSVNRVVSADASVVSSGSATARLFQIQLSGGTNFWIPDDNQLMDSSFYDLTWEVRRTTPPTHPAPTNSSFSPIAPTTQVRPALWWT